MKPSRAGGVRWSLGSVGLVGLVGLVGPMAACGDDRDPVSPDAAPVCHPPGPPAPTDGTFARADELPLPADCVAGGLGELPGRWFLRSARGGFVYSYPRFTGDCATGLGQAGVVDDRDASDGRTQEAWTDGTRFTVRDRIVSTDPTTGEVLFERAYATAVCLMPDGRLASGFGVYNPETGVEVVAGHGVRFAPLEEPSAQGLALVGELDAAVVGDYRRDLIGYNVVVDAGVAYVVGPNGLDLIDVHDPSRPRLVGHVADGFNDVRVVHTATRTVAFVATLQLQATQVFDVSDPTRPQRLVDLPDTAHSLFVRQDGARTLLYLAGYTETVPVYDVTNPAEPVRLGAAAIPFAAGQVAQVHDLYADGDFIYAAAAGAGMVALDVRGGLDAAVARGRIPAEDYSHAVWAATVGGRQVILHGDEGMNPEGGALLRILDGDPASPTFLAELARYHTRAEVGIHNLLTVGNLVYIAYYQDGVRVLDLSDPRAPREVAHYNTWDDATAPGQPFEGALGIRIEGGLIYVADTARGLLILRATP